MWFFGQPGSGKSTHAFSLAGPDGAYKHEWQCASSLRFFDGYQPGTRTIIFDDLAAVGHSLTVANVLKQLCHKHPATADIKGGRIHLQHDRLIVTSNYTP